MRRRITRWITQRIRAAADRELARVHLERMERVMSKSIADVRELRQGLTLFVSEFAGPARVLDRAGTRRCMQLTSAFDIVQLDRVAVLELHRILGEWLTDTQLTSDTCPTSRETSRPTLRPEG